jgi:LEA14-like dessication related protein
MKKNHIVLFVFVLLCSLVYTACQSFVSELREPVLSLNSVDVANITFTGIDMVARVNVENPNGFSIPFPQVDWEFFIEGNSFVNGVIKNDNTIKARKTTVVDVPFSVTYEGVYKTLKSIKEAAGSGEAAYAVSLGVTFPIPLIQSKTFTFEHEGRIPLLQMPKISAPSFKIANAGFDGIGIVCSFNVENPNVFPLPFPKVDWDYSVNKTSFIKSSLSETKPLPAKAVTPVDIRVDIAYAELFKAIQSVAAAGEAPFVMNLNAAFPIPALENPGAALEIPGTIPLLKRPELSFKGIGARNISLQRAEFVFNWEVENKNNFSMDIDVFDYDLKVNNVPWARGRIADPPKIGPNKVTAIPLLVTVNSLDMIRELTTIMSARGDVSYVCAGAVSLSGGPPGLGTIDMPFNFSGTTKLRN